MHGVKWVVTLEGISSAFNCEIVKGQITPMPKDLARKAIGAELAIPIECEWEKDEDGQLTGKLVEIPPTAKPAPPVELEPGTEAAEEEG